MDFYNGTSFSEIYGNLILCTTPDKFYLQPVQNETVIVTIDRITEEKKVEQNTGQIPESADKKRIHGVLGIIKLISGPHLVVVTKKKRVGPIGGHSIWQVVETEVISFSRSLLHLSLKQLEINKKYLNMIESVLDTPYFYFSYTYDITHTMQRLHNTVPNFLAVPMHERADARFLWNKHLLKEFCTIPELGKFSLPIIHGFISVNPFSFTNGNSSGDDTKTFLWTIVSRRSCQRPGTRLFRRGIDNDGNVGNFVETEQIVEYQNNKSSYVQVRGSIPLFWNQYPDLHLKTPIKILLNENHTEACTKHFNELITQYNEIVLVNLIDQHGREAPIGGKYRELVNNIDNKAIRYEAFDFHHECKNMQWHKLQILIDRLTYEQDQFRYFFMNTENKLLVFQAGVFRTNCIDCLDRTNVVQSMFAWRSLNIVLEQLGLISPNSKTKEQEQFHELFQSVWADNADCISMQYSGASALKTDYTRTGKRTYLGMLNDGYNTLLRYYKNNLKDGFRQDALDLFVGNYVVQEGECLTANCPLDTVPSWRYIICSIFFLMAVAMFFANAIFPSEYDTNILLSLLFWGAMVTIAWSLIILYGTEFVDWPKLKALNNIRES